MATPSVARHGVHAATAPAIGGEDHHASGPAGNAGHSAPDEPPVAARSGHGGEPDPAGDCGVVREARLTAPDDGPEAAPGPVAPGAAGLDRAVMPIPVSVADRAPPTRPPRLMLALIQVLRV